MNVPLRCAAAAFDVKQGLMTSRALVLDTTDTVVYGDGTINLATEAMDLYFRPYPKDTSILAVALAAEARPARWVRRCRPDKGALAGRAAAALALGAINPLLALAATIETGPGQDANCGAILRQAAAGGAPTRRPRAMRSRTPSAPGSRRCSAVLAPTRSRRRKPAANSAKRRIPGTSRRRARPPRPASPERQGPAPR